MLDFYRTWLPYIYLYGAGGIVFTFGLFIVLKSRSLAVDRKRHLIWLVVLIFGFIWYMAIHGISSLAAMGQYIYAILMTILMVFVTIFVLYKILSIKRK